MQSKMQKTESLSQGMFEGQTDPLLSCMRELGTDKLTEENRRALLSEVQGFLVERIRYYRTRQRLRFQYYPAKTFWNTIHALLSVASEEGKEGPVAQYLVGAKLQQRFPEIEVGNSPSGTADTQSNRLGDFLIGDTYFYVDVSPASALFKEIKQNIDDGYLAYLLVPDRLLQAARYIAEVECPKQISVGSIESFVGQNVEEISLFDKTNLRKQFRHLLEIYNSRVDSIEQDKSMLIEIPPDL